MQINKAIKSLEDYSKVFSRLVAQEAHLLFLLFHKYSFSNGSCDNLQSTVNSYSTRHI